MGCFKIADDAELGMRLCVTPSRVAAPFKMEVWGAAKSGWFTATCKNEPRLHDVLISQQRLRRGEWRSIVNYVEQGLLWQLPAMLPPPADFVVLDGSSVTLEIQNAHQYCRLERSNVMEPAMARTVNYLLAVSTVFDTDLAPWAAYYGQQVEPLPRLQDRA